MANKPKYDSILFGAPDEDSLDRFVYALNTDFIFWPKLPHLHGTRVIDYRDVRDELRRMVRAWFDSGPNTSTLFGADTILSQAARQSRAFIIPTKTRVAKVAILPGSDDMNPAEPKTIAIGLFLIFLIDPRNHLLRGPCAACGNYFVNKTGRQNRVYCSIRCSRKLTSLQANKKRRAKERAHQLKAVRALIHEWEKKNTRSEWQEWIVNKRIVSKNWLTRALKSGDIAEPKSAKKKEQRP